MGIDISETAPRLQGLVASSCASGLITSETPHICICICTYKRPQYLRRLITELTVQETEGLFTYSLVVVDNDRLRSAESVVRELAASCPVQISYCMESTQNIAMARNQAVRNASGDFIAFIDDD